MFLCDRCQQINFTLAPKTAISGQQEELAGRPESLDYVAASSIPSATTSRTATFETARTSLTLDASDKFANALGNLRRIRSGGSGSPGKHLQERRFVTYVLHESRESWIHSLEDGCRLCLLISSQLLRDELPRNSKRTRREAGDEVEDRDDGLGDNFMVLKRRWPALPQRVEQVEQRYEETEEDKRYRERLSGTADVHVRSRLGGACLQAIEDLPEDYKAIYRESSEDHVGQDTSKKRKQDDRNHKDHTGSATNFKLASKWLEKCQREHEFCRTGTTEGHQNPSRLVDVRDPDRPFLLDVRREQREEAIPYVALSYCWGHGKRVLTLQANYQDHLREIPTQTLPKTLKDAFEVVRELGFQYIWTDAFCIIQDDDGDDKKKEIRHMGDIYRYATFTICAEGAPNAHAGLFHERDARIYQPCTIDLRITGEDGNCFSTKVTLATKCERVDYLQPRGWVLQEEILACRRLLFGKQMRWRCIQSVASEVRPVSKGQRDPLIDGQATEEDKLRMWLYEAKQMEAGEADRARWFRWNHFDSWYSILDIYGRKELTAASDVLNAVNGLATMFSRAHTATYLCGLWKEDLQVGLSWYVCNNERRQVEKCTKNWASWSWASVGKVALRFPKCPSQAILLVEQGAMIVSASVEGSDDPAQHGKLEIQSRVKRGIVVLDDASAGSRDVLKPTVKGERIRFPAALHDGDDAQTLLGHVALDEPSGGRSGDTLMEVVCLLLHIQKAKGQYHSVGLVLQEVGEGVLAHRRVGLAFFEPIGKLEAHPLWDGETKTIAVV